MCHIAVNFFSKVWQRVLYPVRPYWTANIYGFGKWIRRYGYYPPCLPLCIYTDHGPGETGATPTPHEAASSAPVQFYHSAARVGKWRKISNRPCYTLFSPFVFARHSLGIECSNKSVGTIFFVAHSTPAIEARKSIEEYHQEITALPERFHPVTICLHVHDVKKGLDRKYSEYGYRVVTAGDSLDPRFTVRFYRLLEGHKYALSNLFGSYGFYTTEMGIPFGLYGKDPEYFNQGDPNVEKGEYKSYRDTPYYKRVIELFGHLPDDEVTQDQLDFAKYHLGLNEGVTRTEMAGILYKSLFIWLGNRIKCGFQRLIKIVGRNG